MDKPLSHVFKLLHGSVCHEECINDDFSAFPTLVAGFFFLIRSTNSGTGGRMKGAWNEEQEEELRRLFMENQENPESDQGKRSFPFVFFFRVACTTRKWKRDQGNYIKNLICLWVPSILFCVNWIEVKAIAGIQGIHVRCIVLLKLLGQSRFTYFSSIVKEHKLLYHRWKLFFGLIIMTIDLHFIRD